MIAILTWTVLALAAIPALLFIWNLLLYVPPPLSVGIASVSVLIPARNEEFAIEASVRAALNSRDVDLEVIVLDDHSEDRTAEIVSRIAREDSRLRLFPAPELPPSWCGKQFACSVLAELATKPIFCFLDADVRLSPAGAARMAAALKLRNSGLVSGFPRQITETALEQLLLPLMHFLLLGYLPFIGMRKVVHPSFGAGCGQIFVTSRDAYGRAGGHAAIKSSRHDGITLPRAFRKAGIMTDLFDATSIASCRMYHNAAGVFLGLLKNATEGLASPSRIVPFSVLLLAGQILPIAIFAWLWSRPAPELMRLLISIAVAAVYLPRLLSAWRFRQPVLAAFFHPLALAILLGIQWYALVLSLLKVPATWKGRSYSTT